MKWKFGAVSILIVVVIACIFYYQYETVLYKEQAAETTEIVRQWKKIDHERLHNVKEQDVIQATSADNEKLIAVKPKTAVKIDNQDRKLNITQVQQTGTPQKTESNNVRVSPFGFGPYPEIPEGFPEPDIFDSLETMGNSDMRKALELQKRLIVEFYRQGKSLENVGVRGDADGRVYLNYPDVVYVTWDYWTDADGITHKYAGTANGHPDAMQVAKPYLDKGENPPDITVYELPDGYIDAYEYLGLKC